MDKDLTREFKHCPACGSEDRFFEQLGKEIKERGIAREEWNMHLDVKSGVVVDQAKEAAIPIGSEVPSYGFATDICMDCGCIYAIGISRGNVKKQVAPPQMPQPNRAQRRRMGGEGPEPINPFSKS